MKSFTNIQLNDGVNQQLSAIGSMPVGLIPALSTTFFRTVALTPNCVNILCVACGMV